MPRNTDLAHFLLLSRQINQLISRDMQKVFITGITGFLGSHLAKKMFEAGWFVAGNDSLIGSDRSNLHKFVEFYEIDCCDLSGMQKAMVDSDLVFHCAATAHPPRHAT